MKVHCFDNDNLPGKELVDGLVRFEESFVYPLGTERTFTISHAPDYLRFYQSMGESVCFVAQSDKTGAILGTVSAVLRTVTFGSGAGEAQSKQAVYIGDLKLAATARKGFALLRLARALETWVLAKTKTDCAFSVVMDGTELTPPGYTGRAGIEAFANVGQSTVFFVDLRQSLQVAMPDALSLAHDERASAIFTTLAGSCRYVEGGDAATRSELTPIWLATKDKQACGRLEDTIKAKQLKLANGEYLKAAHLVNFVFATTDSGVHILASSLTKATELGYDYLIFAVDSRYTAAFDQALNGRSTYTKGGATVFATNKLMPDLISQSGAQTDPQTGAQSGPWIINTAEI